MEAAQNLPEPKFCVDCKWIGDGEICMHAAAHSSTVNLVTGNKSEDRYSCKIEREFKVSGGCGPDGKNWKAK